MTQPDRADEPQDGSRRTADLRGASRNAGRDAARDTGHAGDVPEDEDELFDTLRAAWAALPAPAATPELAAPDAETAAVLRWMQAAYAAVAVPATPPLPSSLPLTSPRLLDAHGLSAQRTRGGGSESSGGRRRRDVPAWQRQLAAAAVLLVFLGLLQLPRSAAVPRALPRPGSQPPVAAEPPEAPEQAPQAAPGRTDIPGFRAAGAKGSTLLAVADDHLVLRSGPVRLVLFTSTPAAATDALPPLP